MERNNVGWFEIYVQDIDRARKFYESVFRVALEKLDSPEGDASELEMLMFPGTPERPGCNGALVKMDGVASGGGGTLVYFSCIDCATEAGRAQENGGKVIKPKFSIGQYGHIALVSDTEGNMIGLHSMA